MGTLERAARADMVEARKPALRRARPTRATPIPRNAARRAQAVHPPHAVILQYTTGLVRVTRQVMQAVRGIVTDEVIKSFAAPEPEEHTDAVRLDASVKSVMKRARRAAAKALERSGVKSLSDMAANRTDKHGRGEFKRLGISVKDDPTFQPLLSGWAQESVSRVSGMHDDQLGKVEELLVKGHHRRHESIARDIEDQLDDVSESRAAFIARDQIGSLNSKITRHRHKAAGITHYIWTTAGDERVRDEHEEIDGEKFSWDDPPEFGHPGEDYNCRCVAFAHGTELDGGDED